MAKNTTEAEVVVTCNGEAARNEIERLEKEIEEYTKAAAEAYQAGDKALGDKMAKKVGQLSKSLDAAKKNVKSMTEVIKNINSATITELTAASKQLQSELKKTFSDRARVYRQVEAIKTGKPKTNRIEARLQRRCGRTKEAVVQKLVGKL